MTDEASDSGRPGDVVLRCGGCGAAMRARGPDAVRQCPRCRSTDLRELPVPGGAFEYACADRRHGTTAADVAFAEWAKWCGYVTPNQYNTAMHRQNSEQQKTGVARPIHEVMISMGQIDPMRAEGLLRFLCRSRPDEDDEDFLARLKGLDEVDPEKVRAVAELQRRMAARRHEVPPIGQLLVQRRVLTEVRMLEVLRAQTADGRGSLQRALAMSQPPPKETAAGRVLRKATGSPAVLRGIAVAAVLVMAAVGVWAWRFREEPLYVLGRCTNCEAVQKVEWSAYDWPVVCARCGRKTVYYAVVCPNGHVYTRAFPFTNEPCPECGADRGRPLTEQDLRRPVSR